MFPTYFRRQYTNLYEKTTEIRFDEKMANKSGEGFLLNTKFYKRANDAALLAPQKRNPEGKKATRLEGMYIKKKENTTTKTIAM